jgi:hypothetical protein
MKIRLPEPENGDIIIVMEGLITDPNRVAVK